MSVPERYFDPRRRPQALRDVLAAYLETSGLARLMSHPGLYLAWREAVGEEVAAHTRVASFRGGILEVEVDSSVLLHRLAGFQKQQILQALQEKKTGLFVEGIKFKLGSFRA